MTEATNNNAKNYCFILDDHPTITQAVKSIIEAVNDDVFDEIEIVGEHPADLDTRLTNLHEAVGADGMKASNILIISDNDMGAPRQGIEKQESWQGEFIDGTLAVLDKWKSRLEGWSNFLVTLFSGNVFGQGTLEGMDVVENEDQLGSPDALKKYPKGSTKPSEIMAFSKPVQFSSFEGIIKHAKTAFKLGA